MSGSSSSLCWSEGEEDRVADLSRDKTLLILKVKGLEDQVLKLMRIKIRNEDVMKRQAEEINGLSNQLKGHFIYFSLLFYYWKVGVYRE
jgi:hypothetical protein